jgi:hypothetical protein
VEEKETRVPSFQMVVCILWLFVKVSLCTLLLVPSIQKFIQIWLGSEICINLRLEDRVCLFFLRVYLN